MKSKRTYYYLNLYLFSTIRTFIFFLFCLNVVLFVYHLWHIAAVLIPVFIFIVYIILHIGTIHIQDDQNGLNLKVGSLFKSVRLQCPISYTTWWNYSQNAGINVFGSLMSGRARPTANDVYVYLHLKDINGKQLCFQERIELDTRFPNDVQYEEKTILDDCTVLRAQRTDKVVKWMQSFLQNEDLKLTAGKNES